MFTVIIPARYASSRLPAKPLADIHGKPMIQWVYEQAIKSKASRVVVATDDARIESAVKAFGAQVVMTAVSHESGTDRLQEAAAAIGLSENEVVINVQGDEPLIPHTIIDQLYDNIVASQADIATLSEAITTVEEYQDPNAVKVVTTAAGMALYFSRASVPFLRDGDGMPQAIAAQRHIGIYAYRVSFLNEFVTWPMAAIEATEKLEQLRALYHGKTIHVAEAIAPPPTGVDTQADLERVRALLA